MCFPGSGLDIFKRLSHSNGLAFLSPAAALFKSYTHHDDQPTAAPPIQPGAPVTQTPTSDFMPTSPQSTGSLADIFSHSLNRSRNRVVG